MYSSLSVVQLCCVGVLCGVHMQRPSDVRKTCIFDYHGTTVDIQAGVYSQHTCVDDVSVACILFVFITHGLMMNQ